jgi:DNA-binding NtrC family response regulator
MVSQPVPDWRTSGANRKLLLFESLKDNICEALGPMFQKAGFQTQVVTTVRACMEVVRQWSPNVVLMITNNMWEEPAFEVASAIRVVHPKCGFVFMAGSEEESRQRFISAGYKFDVHWIPMPIRELIALTSQAMDSPLDTFAIPKQ